MFLKVTHGTWTMKDCLSFFSGEIYWNDQSNTKVSGLNGQTAQLERISVKTHQIFSHAREYGRCTLKTLLQLSRGVDVASHMVLFCKPQAPRAVNFPCPLQPQTPARALQPALDLGVCSSCLNVLRREQNTSAVFAFQSSLSPDFCVTGWPGALICVCRAAISTGDFLSHTVRTGF